MTTTIHRYTLNEQEAAAHIGMSRSFLRHRRCEGFLDNKPKGPSFIRIGRTIRYKIQDLENWLNMHKVDAQY